MQAILKSRTHLLCLALTVCWVEIAQFQHEAQAAAIAADQAPRTANHRVDFTKEIQPIFADTCLECHGPTKQKGGLRLDGSTEALKGGETGPLLVPGKSGESLLIQAVTGTKDDLARMPKKRDPLKPEQ